MKHTFSVLGNSLFISGGVTTYGADICGKRYCSDNTYRIARDIWKSIDEGKTWEKIYDDIELGNISFIFIIFRSWTQVNIKQR